MAHCTAVLGCISAPDETVLKEPAGLEEHVVTGGLLQQVLAKGVGGLGGQRAGGKGQGARGRG